MVSVDSASFVNEHLSECPSCKAEYKSMKKTNDWETISVEQGDRKQLQKAFQGVKRKLWLVYFGLTLVGLMIGLSLTSGMELFYNVLIMPIVGVLGYVVFRWKSLVAMPIFLTFIHVVLNVVNLLCGVEALDFLSLVLWTLIYGTFMIVGVLIAGLLHFAFKKEEK
jgi:hypothetical protein